MSKHFARVIEVLMKLDEPKEKITIPACGAPGGETTTFTARVTCGNCTRTREYLDALTPADGDLVYSCIKVSLYELISYKGLGEFKEDLLRKIAEDDMHMDTWCDFTHDHIKGWMITGSNAGKNEIALRVFVRK